ncbi:MAG TPA: EamA family transporter [Solirubrobacteraceae bacterium]
MPTRHALLAALVAVVWGVNFVVIHVGLESFPPLLFVALRFTLVAFPAVLFVRRPRVGLRWVLAVGTFMCAGQFALVFVAMDQGMPAGLASLVLQTQALFTIGLGVLLLAERPARRAIAGAVVATAGIAVIATGRAEAVPLGALLLCVAAGASWGVGNIAVRKAQAPDALALLIWASLIPPLPMLGLSVLLGEPAPSVGLGGVAALAYVVVLSTFFGFGIWTWLMREHAVAKVAPFTLLVPPVGIAAAWLALGERPSVTELTGAAIVLLGLAIVQGLMPRRAAPPVPAAQAPAPAA